MPFSVHPAARAPWLRLVVWLCAAVLTCGNSDGKSAWFLEALEAGQPQTIVLYGTSLTANSAWPGGFKSVLRANYGTRAKVINAAKGSMDSRWGLANLQNRVVRRQPDVVFIEFAINDALESSALSTAESARNLRTMIRTIRTARPDCGIYVMIMNPSTGSALACRPRILAYEAAYRKIARENRCGLIDFSPRWRQLIAREPERWRSDVPDGLHPGPRACREIILPELMRKLGFAGGAR